MYSLRKKKGKAKVKKQGDSLSNNNAEPKSVIIKTEVYDLFQHDSGNESGTTKFDGNIKMKKNSYSVKTINTDCADRAFNDEYFDPLDICATQLDVENTTDYSPEAINQQIENNQAVLENDLQTNQKTFESKSKKSSQSVKNGRKEYKCDKCGKKFSYKSNLNVHLRLHAGIKPFECDICKKKFAQRSHLFNHMTNHTDCELYKCDICEKLFSQKSHLNDHLKIHKAAKFHECDVCKKVFRQRDGLVRHKLIHSEEKPFECSHCEKCFRRKGDLVVHERTHTGERPYICNICDKTFTQKSHLIDHERVHTGIKPYSCEFCKKLFSNKSNLNQHKQLVHKF